MYFVPIFVPILYYLTFFFMFNPPTSVVKENAATLFCSEGQEMFGGLRNFSTYPLSKHFLCMQSYL